MLFCARRRYKNGYLKYGFRLKCSQYDLNDARLYYYGELLIKRGDGVLGLHFDLHIIVSDCSHGKPTVVREYHNMIMMKFYVLLPKTQTLGGRTAVTIITITTTI